MSTVVKFYDVPILMNRTFIVARWKRYTTYQWVVWACTWSLLANVSTPVISMKLWRKKISAIKPDIYLCVTVFAQENVIHQRRARYHSKMSTDGMCRWDCVISMPLENCRGAEERINRSVIWISFAPPLCQVGTTHGWQFGFQSMTPLVQTSQWHNDITTLSTENRC